MNHTMKKQTPSLVLAAAVLLSSYSLAAHAAGDVTRGTKLYDEECAECHSLKEGKNKKGPFLLGIMGRKSAAIADFTYSDAMRAKGVVWNAELIEAYIRDPKREFPNGKMKYDGMPDAVSRTDITAFLATQK